MTYMLEIYALVAGIVFAVAGMILMVLVALRQVREFARFARARLAVRRIPAQVPVPNMNVSSNRAA